jgi:hypothetical protein
MKKNQKYNRENIFPMIESWRESKQSQAKFCKENKLSISTIQYWLKKYRETRIETHTQTKLEEQRKSKSFLTVKLAEQEHQSLAFARTGSADRLDIYYPNGVRLSCPISLKPELLRKIINLLIKSIIKARRNPGLFALSFFPESWISACMQNSRNNYCFVFFVNSIVNHKREHV